MCEASTAALADQACGKNLASKFADIFRRRQTRQTQNRHRASRRHFRFSACRLNVHKFGDKNIVIAAPMFPPFPRRGLLAMQDGVPARPSTR